MRTNRFTFQRAATALSALCALVVSLSQPARADTVTPPAVPGTIEVPAGHSAFLVAHAVGTQNYVCVRSARGFEFVLFTPQATLFDDDDQQVTTHYFSPNPSEDDLVRATWQHSGDTSTFWGKGTGSSTDPAFVADGAIAWLRIERTGVAEGPTGGGTLAATTFIQRVNTAGGVAPSTDCASAPDIGNQAFVPYTADYVFYAKDP
jgi:hypothetical protein